jgi:hypothetical protein
LRDCLFKAIALNGVERGFSFVAVIENIVRRAVLFP